MAETDRTPKPGLLSKDTRNALERYERIGLTLGDFAYLIGYLAHSEADAMHRALDAIERRRERRAHSAAIPTTKEQGS